METKIQAEGRIAKLLNESEFNRFGLICVILTVVGCMGGTAVGMGAIGSTFSLTMVTIPTMLTLSLLLAVSPMRWILSAAALSVGIDLIMIIYYTLLT